MLSRKQVQVGLSGLVAACLVGTAQASIMDFQNAVSSHPNLMHHWTFEGADDAARFADQAGGKDLEQRVYGSAFTGVDFATGFDGSSQAMVTKRQGGDTSDSGGSGAAAATQTLMDSLPSSFTAQAMFRPDQTSVDENPWGLGYILPARNASSRGYLLKQGGPGAFAGGKGINTLIGDWSDQNVLEIIADGNIQTGDWYFWTSTFEYDAVNDETTVTAYLGNMSEDSQDGVLDNLAVITGTIDGGFPILGAGNKLTKLGVGGFSNDKDEFESTFPGMVDEVAIYDTVLSESEVRSQYGMIPEPGSLALVSVGAGLVLIRRKR